MLSWVKSYWTEEYTSGPARNAPNNGIDIRKTLNQYPKQIICVPESVIKETLLKLRKTETRKPQTDFLKTDIMEELSYVFAEGHSNYFQRRKEQKNSIYVNS